MAGRHLDWPVAVGCRPEAGPGMAGRHLDWPVAVGCRPEAGPGMAGRHLDWPVAVGCLRAKAQGYELEASGRQIWWG